MIFARGYTRTVVWAVDFRTGSLTTRWILDWNSSGSQYTGQATTGCPSRTLTATAGTRTYPADQGVMHVDGDRQA
jgi:hypothetical protein